MKLPEKVRNKDINLYYIGFEPNGTLCFSFDAITSLSEDCLHIYEDEFTEEELCEIFSDDKTYEILKEQNSVYPIMTDKDFLKYLRKFYNKSSDKLKLLLEVHLGAYLGVSKDEGE